ALDSAERELVSAHLDLCPACSRQLSSYQQAAPAMDVPVMRMVAAQPAQLAPARISFGERLRTWLITPQSAIAALALAIIAVTIPVSVVPYLESQKARSGGGEATARLGSGSENTSDVDLDLPPLQRLPEALREDANTIVTTTEPEPPLILQGVPNAN